MANDLISLLTTDFPDNTVGSITPAILRSYMTTLVGQMPALNFKFTSLNLHSAASDNQVPILLPSNINRYLIDKIYLHNLSVGLSTCSATLGLYTGAAASGSTISTAQAVTLLSTTVDSANNLQALTVSNNFAFNDGTLYARVVNASSVALTADFIVTIKPLT
jgi:hypothetical protein